MTADNNETQDFPDELDKALAALWKGESDEFGRLMENKEGFNPDVGAWLGPANMASLARRSKAPHLFETHNDHAGVLHEQVHHEEAEIHLTKALDASRTAHGDNHANTLIAASTLAAFYLNANQFDKAEPLFRETISIGLRTLSEGHWFLPVVHAHLGKCLANLERLEEAEKELLASFESISEALGKDHPRTAMIRANVAELYDALNKPDKAAQWRATTSSH